MVVVVEGKRGDPVLRPLRITRIGNDCRISVYPRVFQREAGSCPGVILGRENEPQACLAAMASQPEADVLENRSKATHAHREGVIRRRGKASGDGRLCCVSEAFRWVSWHTHLSK